MRYTLRSLPLSLAVLGVAVPSSLAEPVFETNTYRFGASYDRVAATSPKACAYACQNDAACLSWSYVRAGVWGDAAVCELKTHIGRPEHNPSAVSGLSPRHEAKFDGQKRGWLSEDPDTASESLAGGTASLEGETRRITHIYPGYKAGAAERTYSATYRTASYGAQN